MSDYHKEVKKKETIKLRELIQSLPAFVREYFRGIENGTTTKTRLGYAHDFLIFFDFLTQHVQEFMDKGVTELSLTDLGKVKPEDIEDFLEYLNFYVRVREDADGGIIEKELENEISAKSRKLSALRSLYSYFYVKQKIMFNPTDFVNTPKQHAKAIVRLEPDEVAMLLDEVEAGDSVSEHNKAYNDKTKLRDLALLSLLLGTGMRISECIGINIEHLDFNNNSVKITRKGGKEAIIYFNREVAGALSDYLVEREKVKPFEGHEGALFLSMQRKRMTDRAIENMVKKFAQIVTPLKNITPHKLRSTFGTSLYNETNDIYLVASALGHANVETTKKYYAHMDEDRLRSAAKVVKLRE